MSLANLLRQTCTINIAGAVDKFGKNAFGTAVGYPCRFEKTSRTIVTAQSEQTPIDGIVFLDPTATIDIGYKLTFVGIDYRVMRVEPIVDGRGKVRHNELMVQRWSV